MHFRFVLNDLSSYQITNLVLNSDYMGFILVYYPYLVYGFGVPKNLFVRGSLDYQVLIANQLLCLV